MRHKRNKDRPPPIQWDSLSLQKRKKLLVRSYAIARRLRPRLKTVYGDNVESIGVGFRTKGKSKQLRRELVIRIFVKKKWRKGTKTNDCHCIPKYFSTTFKTISGRKILTKIPTDVNQIGRGKLHRTTVRVSEGSDPIVGSICCVLEDADTAERFLLSCNHVFGLVGNPPTCEGTLDAQIDSVDPDQKALARIVRQRDVAGLYPNQQQFSLDSAIARIELANFRRRTDGYPALDVLRNTSAIHPGDKLKIPARSGVLTATVAGIIEEHPILVECNETTDTWLFRRLLEYSLSPTSKPGDSGAPLMDASLLVGMHFYYDAHLRHGFAMLAADLLKTDVFGRALALVPDT